MYNQDDLQNERRRQINTLKIFNDNVSETITNSEYRVDFLSGSNKFSLLVHLSHYFPLDRPVLKIYPAINHSWVDPSGNDIVSAPGLLNFSRHSDLGRVVQAIIRELQLRPPLIVGQQLPNIQSYNSSHTPTPTPPHIEPIPNSTLQPRQPTISSSLPELSKLSLEELKMLDENEDYLEAFVKSMSCMEEYDKVVDSLIVANEALANENLEQENALIEKSEDLKVKVGILTELQTKHEMKNSQYDQLVEKYAPHNIKDQLMRRVAVHEGESDVIVENFLDSKINLDTFLSSYLEKRVVAHRLQTKGERLSYQLEALEKASH